MIESTSFMWRFTLILFLVVSANSAEAWTPRTYQLIVAKSIRLMPLSFRNVMLQHKEELLIGCLRPDELPESAHAYDLQARNGYLLNRVRELSTEIPRKIFNHAPFRDVALDLGRLSHYMADLNDPLLLADDDPREPQYRADFAQYLERKVDLFPWIFDGHEQPLLSKDQLSEYLYSIASDAVRSYPLLGQSYFPNGTLVSSDTFSPKSLPFGIASLSYSHSVSHTVQIWFHVWKKSHGDIGFTPFYSKSKKGDSP